MPGPISTSPVHGALPRRRRRLPGAALLAPTRPPIVAPPAGAAAWRTLPARGRSATEGAAGGWLLLPDITGVLLGPLSTGNIIVPTGLDRRLTDVRFRQLLSLADARPDLAWKPGRSVALARNAHSTNTDEEMTNALTNEYDYLEGDVRRAPDGTLVMAHQEGDANGITLDEWYAIALRSGRGIKIDVKEGAAVVAAVRRARQLGVPPSRLVINVTVRGLPSENITLQQLRTIRKLYPTAIVNLSVDVDRYTDEVVDDMSRWALAARQPVMFPLRHDLLDEDVVRRLKPFGRVAVWNTPTISAPADLDEAARRLRAIGVNGTIDLREAGTWERLARPFVRASIQVFGWGATVSLLRVGALVSWLTRPADET